MCRIVFCLALLSSVPFSFSQAQSIPAIVSAYGKEITVDGMADPTAGPITLFDTSYPAQTRLGRGNVSRDGRFAAVVKPALMQGHRIVAIDRKGRRSSEFIVAPARSGDVPGPAR